MKKTRTHYQVLGIDPWADEREIRRAYRRLTRTARPDAHPGLTAKQPSDAEQISILNEALRTLGDPGRRFGYDRAIGVDLLRDRAVGAWTPPPLPGGFVLFPSGFPTGLGYSMARFADARLRALSLVALTPDLSPLGDLAPNGVWKLVVRARITDEQLAHLAEMRSLRILDLSATAVSDAGLKNIGALPSIESLSLAKTKVSDRGLMHLRNLTKLDTLDLRGTKVRGPGLSHLHGLRNLDHVFLPWRVGIKWRRLLKQAVPHASIA